MNWKSWWETIQGEKYREWIFLACAAFVGLVNNVILLYLSRRPEPRRWIGDEEYYILLSREIASGLKPSHDLVWPRTYGDLIGWFFREFGEHHQLLMVIQALVWLAGGILLYLFVKRCVSVNAALVSAFLYWSSLELSAFSHFIWPEIPHLVLFMLAIWLLSRETNCLCCDLVAGFALGFALLFKLILMPFMPVLLLAVWILGQGKFLYRFFRMLVCAGAVVLIVLPVMIQNAREFGAFVIGDSSTLNLYLGLIDSEKRDFINDRAPFVHFDFVSQGETLDQRNQVYRTYIRDELNEKGSVGVVLGQLETQYFRLFGIQTFFTTMLPGGARDAYRFEADWLASALRVCANFWHLAILGLFPLGIAATRWQRRTWLWIPLLFLIYNLAVMFWVHVKTRYLIQMQPAMILFAGVAIVSLIGHFRRDRERDEPIFSRNRWWLGLSGAFLLWYYALGGVILP